MQDVVDIIDHMRAFGYRPMHSAHPALDNPAFCRMAKDRLVFCRSLPLGTEAWRRTREHMWSHSLLERSLERACGGTFHAWYSITFDNVVLVKRLQT